MQFRRYKMFILTRIIKDDIGSRSVYILQGAVWTKFRVTLTLNSRNRALKWRRDSCFVSVLVFIFRSYWNLWFINFDFKDSLWFRLSQSLGALGLLHFILLHMNILNKVLVVRHFDKFFVLFLKYVLLNILISLNRNHS